jgi:hypothetical protein
MVCATEIFPLVSFSLTYWQECGLSMWKYNSSTTTPSPVNAWSGFLSVFHGGIGLAQGPGSCTAAGVCWEGFMHVLKRLVR